MISRKAFKNRPIGAQNLWLNDQGFQADAAMRNGQGVAFTSVNPTCHNRYPSPSERSGPLRVRPIFFVWLQRALATLPHRVFQKIRPFGQILTAPMANSRAAKAQDRRC